LTYYTKTLSQTFDTDDFIAPDTLSVVNGSVRAAAEDVLVRGGLSEELNRVFKTKTYDPVLLKAVVSAAVPSLDPDEFMHYEAPEAPVIADYAPPPPLPAEAPADMDVDVDAGLEAGLDPGTDIGIEAEIEIAEAEMRDDPVLMEGDISIELPQISRINRGMMRLKLDTLTFEKGFRQSLRDIGAIAGISITIIILVYYLLNHTW